MREQHSPSEQPSYIDLFFFALGCGVLVGWATGDRDRQLQAKPYDVVEDASALADYVFKEEIAAEERNAHRIWQEANDIVNTAFGNDREEELMKLALERKYMRITGDISISEKVYEHQQEFDRTFGSNPQRSEEDL